jgi:putative ABC transport system permease protein
MIRFLLKGIMNDRSRSLLPVIVVSLGVALTVLLTCFIEGILTDSVRMNANFNTGHLKVTTRAFAADEGQLAAELALMDVGAHLRHLETTYPELIWEQRIRFGGLIDFPDPEGETKIQGPVIGWSIDLLSPGSGEVERFNLASSLIKGSLPSVAGEALISDNFAERFHVEPGDTFTLFGTTMEGGMAFKNFRVSGTVRFGAANIDRGSIVVDIRDAREGLRMEDAATEILGYFRNGDYDDRRATSVANAFNLKYDDDPDPFSPVMLRLKDQGGMAEYMDLSEMMRGILVFVFVLAMSVVLWNTGLLGGLRRYTEFGLRLAMGEEKRHIYRTLILEGVLIGFIGSVTGTLIGLGLSLYLQEVGMYFGDSLQNSSMMVPTVIRAKIIPAAYYIGFLPGVVAMVLGNALSGRGIYKRQTAQLFKELEV